MKLIRTILIILLVIILVLGLALFFVLRTLNLNQYKARVTHYLSQTLGRQVGIDGISFQLSASQGLTLNIQGLSIADHPVFSKEHLLTVDAIDLGLDLLALLTKRQILISNVELRQPTLHMIRTGDGRMNIMSLSEKQNEQGLVVAEPPINPPPPSPQVQDKPEIVFPELFIQSIRISEGSFYFTDQTFDPPFTLPLTQFDFQTDHFAFDQASAFQLACSLWADGQNISMKGTARLKKDQRELQLDNLTANVDLSRISLSQFNKDPFLREKVRLEDRVRGQIHFTVPRIMIGEGGVIAASVDGQLTDGEIPWADLEYPFEGIRSDFHMTESDLEIKKFSASFASGKATLEGRLDEYLKGKEFFFDLRLEDMRLEQLIPRGKLPVAIKGLFYGELEGRGRGLDPTALRDSLEMRGTMHVRDGRLMDVNLLRLVLSKIAFIPDVVEKIEENLPPPYKEKLRQKDTILEKVECDLKTHEGSLFVERAELNADGFLLVASGQLDLEQNLNLAADFYIQEDLSAGMTAAVEELSYLLDGDKRIHIPFKSYRGPLLQARIYPDLEDLGKEIIKKRAEEELKKVIFKALDIEEPEPSPEPSEEGVPTTKPPEEQPEQQQISPERVIIENILDAILK